jgi:hypothetical protein
LLHRKFSYQGCWYQLVGRLVFQTCYNLTKKKRQKTFTQAKNHPTDANSTTRAKIRDRDQTQGCTDREQVKNVITLQIISLCYNHEKDIGGLWQQPDNRCQLQGQPDPATG